MVDLVARTARDFKLGETLHITDPHHHAVAGLEPELIRANPDQANSPVPLYMATDRKLLAGCEARDGVDMEYDRYG